MSRCTAIDHIFIRVAARRLLPIPEETVLPTLPAPSAASEASSLPWTDLLAHTPTERWPWRESTSDPMTPPTPRISKGVPPSPTHLRFERGLRNDEKFFQIQSGIDEYRERDRERERRREAEKSNEGGEKCRTFPAGGSGDIPMRLEEKSQDQEECPVVGSLTRHHTAPLALGSLNTFEASTSALAGQNLFSGRVLTEENVPVPGIPKLQYFTSGIELPNQKRGRGRPPKKTTEKKITREDANARSSAISSGNSANPNQQHGQGRRPRGRPRKEFESKNSWNEKYKRALEGCVAKRGRGRPRTRKVMDGETHQYQIVGARSRNHQSPRDFAGDLGPKYLLTNPKRSNKIAFVGSSMDGLASVPSASTSASAGQIRQEGGQDFVTKIVTLQDVMEVLDRFPVHLCSIPKPKLNALNRRTADACKRPAGRPRKELGLKLLEKGSKGAFSFSNQTQNVLSAAKRSRGRPRKQQNPGQKDPKVKIERANSHLSENPYKKHYRTHPHRTHIKSQSQLR